MESYQQRQSRLVNRVSILSKPKNLKGVLFYRQNRKWKPLKISREKYLRQDINCGCKGCKLCSEISSSFCTYGLNINCPVTSVKFPYKHFLLPDASFVLRNLDVLEVLSDVIILQIVADDVFRTSPTKYKKLREMVKNERSFYFLNEHHSETYVSRSPNESIDERNYRALITAHDYFVKHFEHIGIKVVVLSDDPRFLSKYNIHPKQITVVTGVEYVDNLIEQTDLDEKLCRVPFDDDENVVGRVDFCFPPHLDLNEIEDGIKAGRYYQEAFRSCNFLEGFVKVDFANEENVEILIQGRDNINRATDGDIVAIELLPEREWGIPSRMVVETDEDDTALLEAETIVKLEENFEEPDIKPQVDDTKIVNTAGTTLKKQKSAKVVGIVRRKWLPLCGILRKSQNENSTFHMFIPDNKKIPFVRLELRNPKKFENQKLVVQIDQWPRTSKNPVGHYVKVLGLAGTIETETDAILQEHGVRYDAFSKAVEACLPPLPYEIDASEYGKRKDFRQLLVVSVDPPGCTDIDDALHCQQLSDGSFEVGVHIADVSYYVRPETKLDDEAAKRGTTVYLADRRIDMIPKLLSSDLCSLHPKKDKLVFSVIWKLSSDAEILETNFYKGVINSAASLTYAEAQCQLNSNSTDQITLSLKQLSFLAQILKKKRFENGALLLSAAEVSPEDSSDYGCEESHSMVEEFMLLANCSVAEFTLNSFREFAVLRRHPVPPPSNFEPLLQAARSHGITVIVDEGSKALNESIEKQPDEIKNILRVLTTRCMTQALYCCSGTTAVDLYQHFGLAVNLYTHFTSPIRRYADLMVHRLLAVALNLDHMDPRLLVSKRLHALCENNNLRHRMAQYASRASYNLHRSKLLQGKQEEHIGYVMFVRRNALQIFVPKYSMEGFIFFPKTASYKYNQKEGVVQFGNVILRPLDKVQVALSLEENKNKVLFRLLFPLIPELV